MGKMMVKIYIVLQRINLRKNPDDPNIRVLDVKLTRDAAQRIVDRTPGTWIEKQLASK